MKIVKPLYYDEFVCIADKCDFTCCGNWEIAVDVDTFEKWKKISIAGMNEVVSYTLSKDDAYIIKLDDERKCPFLNECGLCKMVLSHGEENISYTCHTFPREIREYQNRTEYGLALGCKSVINLLWNQSEFIVDTFDNENANNEINEYFDVENEADEEEIYFELRDYFLDIMSDKERNPTVSLKVIFIILLDIFDQIDNLNITIYNDDDSFTDEFRKNEKNIIKKIISEWDINETTRFANEERVAVFDRFIEDNALLLDIMENYRKKGIYTEYIEEIALEAEAFEQSEYRKLDEMKLIDIENEFDQLFNEKMRLIIQEELYDSLLPAMNDIYCIAMKVEWLAIEYAVITQWMRLKWLKMGKVSIEDLKNSIAVCFRMTGYSDDDIIEYMEDCFEESIWDFGYFDLLI